MLKHTIVIFSLIISSALMAQTQPEKLTAVSSLAENIVTLRTYQADFEQQVFNEIGKQIDVSSGTFVIEKPNHFRWHTIEMFEQLIVADGDHIFTYDPDLEQVTIQNQSEILADSPLLFLTSNAEQLEQSFDITLVDSTNDLANQNKQLFHLKPKTATGIFESVHILFNQGQLSELMMQDTLGQQTTVKFSNIQMNAKLDVSLFRFVTPEGTDVVDSRTTILNKSATPKN